MLLVHCETTATTVVTVDQSEPSLVDPMAWIGHLVPSELRHGSKIRDYDYEFVKLLILFIYNQSFKFQLALYFT